MSMCPQCGRVVRVTRAGLTYRHGGGCVGSGQVPRCAESDGRPLWSGQPNPHFYRRAADHTERNDER